MDKSKRAFPVPHVTHVSGDNEPVYFQGMTLREYAAVAAMQGQLAAQGPEVGEWSESAFPELARISVAIAEALLARLEDAK